MRGRRRREGERQRGREAELVTLKYNGSHHKGAAERGKKVINSEDPLGNIYIYFKEEHKRCNLNEMSDESVNGRRRHCGGGIHDDVCPEYV